VVVLSGIIRFRALLFGFSSWLLDDLVTLRLIRRNSALNGCVRYWGTLGGLTRRTSPISTTCLPFPDFLLRSTKHLLVRSERTHWIISDVRRATDLARRLINGPTTPIADVRRELARVKARSVGLLEQAIEGLEARAAEPVSKATTSTPKDRTELLTLKPGIWGLNFDLKEAWRRVRRWWQTRK
jgi:hypothetical protein